MDNLDKKITELFDGKVVRKDLLHRIKKGTNVPTFVLEFLLARYCASDEPDEIQEGMEAVLETLQDNYVRPNEANTAQSKVATKGSHRFIDKVHVRYVEKEKRHWASLENFNSQRIAIGQKFYKDNDRLLEGGIWAEVTLAYNDIEEDKYAFYVEDLRPIQLSRFDFKKYGQGRKAFSRDEWLDLILRSVGLEPGKLNHRQKFHFINRLAPLVEANYNFIELGPRGTGKSYFFSEFSPYSTLISGGQATKATLFYNNNRKKIGLVGFWDTVAFDEVGGIKIKDPDTIQIMKDFMANGRFSRGVEVIADASLAFVGNIDQSVKQIVNSSEYDLFQPLPPQFDLAVMDRFASYIPGWEMPKTSSAYLTGNYGFITDYLAEAFHYQLKHSNRFEEVSCRIKLGNSVEGRDEKGIKKTVCAFLKILHPEDSPSDRDFEAYVAYAIENRRRIKEQMNKRKPDDEFAKIDLSYFAEDGNEVVVYCPESKSAQATQNPVRSELESVDQEAFSKNGLKNKKSTIENPVEGFVERVVEEVVEESIEEGTESSIKGVVEKTTINNPGKITKKIAEEKTEPVEQHLSILYGDTGHSYESIISAYLENGKEITIEDPYIRSNHQIHNFVRFCEAVIKSPTIRKINLITSYDEFTPLVELQDKLGELQQSLLEMDIELNIEINPQLHDREIRIDNGWVIKIGRGLDFYQKPDSWYEIGVNDLSLRKCLETKVDIFRKE
ncbi:ATP-dependent Lon protease [Desulfamplus magnetovallimortis]|uniref:ATP-dependent Lon protease n=1 Tax=Desulfamplus magnetovallimortis TaxID=1246637 RepID=A0A1W1H531_9BACT|nr:BREX system Lon protease-like protein BrxL [Desulfamplus magnetovallimortis]SLM27557.1 ATP-dependent Lon protease [Desulfamplus magnetovallimortis]